MSTSANSATPNNSAECTECTESRTSWNISRRGLLAGGVAAGAAIALSENMSVHSASAATSADADTLIVLSLRGGMDGLSVVVPTTDRNYYDLRPNLAIPANKTIKLDRRFGLHPGLAPLEKYWKNGTLGVVHGAGVVVGATRSHFAATEQIERAAIGSDLRSGWIERTIGLGGVPDSEPFRLTSFGSMAPKSTLGEDAGITLKSIAEFSLPGGKTVASINRWGAALKSLYSTASGPVAAPALSALDGLKVALELRESGYSPGANYPDGELGASLQDAAQLIKSPHKVSAITIDVDGWDMHSELGTYAKGHMMSQMENLGKCLDAFAKDLGPLMNKVTLVTISEFGRRTEENASGGVDHGWGNAMFILGGGVRNKKTVVADWAGLGQDSLYQGDLAATTDYRNVLGDILINRCGASISQAKAIFPNWDGTTTNLLAKRA